MLSCDIDGCDSWGVWKVSDGEYIRLVCRKCRDELAAVFGWEIIR